MRIRKELGDRLVRLQPLPAIATEGQELSERVITALRPALLMGELPRGMRLIEDEVAAHLGVSRGPVREAFQVLAHEGLVTALPRRGATVVGVTERDIRELYDLRRVLEMHAIRLATTNARPEDIDYLRDLSNRLGNRNEDQTSPPAALDASGGADIAFHRHLFIMANQQRLRAAWERTAGPIGTLLAITGTNRPQFIRHGFIVEAIESGDPDAAATAIETHVTNAEGTIVRLFRAAARTQGQKANTTDAPERGRVIRLPTERRRAAESNALAAQDV